MRGKWLAGVALLGVLGLAWLSARGPVVAEEKKKPEAALPSDLVRVPAQAGAVVSVRVAELWASEPGKRFRKRAGKDVDSATEAIQSALGVGADQIERFTAVLLARPDNPEMLIFRTRKPYKAKLVAQSFVGGGTKQTYKGLTMYVGERDRTVLMVDDKTFVYSLLDGVKSTFEKSTDKAEGLLPALRAAATGKHVAVAGVNPKAILADRLGGTFPPALKPYEPLFRAKGGLLTVDLGEKLRGDLRVTFATPEEARAAEKAGQAAVKMGQGFLGGFIKQLAREKDTAALVKLLRHAEAGLKGSPLKLSKAELTASLEVKVAGAALDEAALQLVKRMRLAAARAQSFNNLKQLGVAMHSYADMNGGRFPPAAVFDKDGKPLLSWRVLLLPYLDQEDLYKEFKLNEAWDSAHNKKLLKKMPRVFAHPAAKGKAYETHYQAFVGDRAAFEGKKGMRLPGDFPDGLSNTILFVEAARAVPWTKPRDLPYDPKKPLPKLGGLFPGGFSAGLCDGAVRFVSSSVSEKTLRAAITRNGEDDLGPDW
jgi:hypothetical protein